MSWITRLFTSLLLAAVLLGSSAALVPHAHACGPYSTTPTEQVQLHFGARGITDAEVHGMRVDAGELTMTLAVQYAHGTLGELVYLRRADFDRPWRVTGHSVPVPAALVVGMLEDR